MYVPMLLAIAGVARASMDVSNTPFLTTVRAVEQDHPPGCLHAYSMDITLQGRLMGIVLPADLQEAMPARAALYLQLDRPISVCAFNTDEPATKEPAYVNVSRIGMGAWSVATYQWIMRKWGQYQIQVTSPLGNIEGSNIGPGLILFSDYKQFCSREINNKKGDFHRISGDAWLQSLPKGGKFEFCHGVECVKELSHFSRFSLERPHLLKGAAPSSLKFNWAAQQVYASPRGCLSYWPHIVTLQGRLGAVEYPGTPEWNPPVHGFVSMSLAVKQPVSLCAAPGLGIPAYTNVSQIGMGLWSIAAAQMLIKKWGQDEIQVVGGLGSIDTNVDSYATIFTYYEQFCSRDLKNKDKHIFDCVPWNTWIQDLGKEVNLAP